MKPATTSSKQQRAVKYDLLSMLTVQSYAGLAVTIACAVLLILAFQNEALLDFKIIWFVVLCCALACRAFTIRHWNTYSHLKTFNLTRYSIFFHVGVAFIAGMWGIYTLMVIPNSTDIAEIAFIITVFTGLAGGATSTLAGSKLACVSYISLLLFPLAISLLLNDLPNMGTLGVLALIFAVLILASGFRATKYTFESANTKYEKDTLVNELESRVEERTKEVISLSNIDALTKLKNRKAFSVHLKQKLKYGDETGSRFALLFIDLDGFKSINDIYGHERGDQILRVISDRLKQSFSQGENICRWGGDEFLALVEDTDEKMLLNESQELITLLAEPVESVAGSLSVNATIGIAIFPEHGRSESELISHADIAMYHQKSISKGKALIFSDIMRNKITRQLTIKEEICHGLENNEFYLAFQPVINIKTQSILFVETLIRWDTDKDYTSPAEFIPIAEQFGLIQQIGRWVAKTACEHISKFSDECSLRLSINVSVAELLQPEFAANLASELERQKVDVWHLVIEITETVLSNDTAQLLKTLDVLRNYGFSIAIDDFGTGFSSLSQIHQLSPEIIKIDRSFIAAPDKSGAPIVQAISDISEKMEFVTVAEGIETEKQEQLAVDSGVYNLQGFKYARPMTFDALIEWYKDFVQG